mgnify:FL=1
MKIQAKGRTPAFSFSAVVFAAVLAAAVLFSFSCAGTPFAGQKPTAEITRFDIEAISLRDVTFLFDIGITNPYPLYLALDAVKLAFLVEDKQAFATETAKGLKIKAAGTAMSTFRVNLKYEDVFRIVTDYAKKDHVDTVVKAEIVIPLPRLPGLPPSASFPYDLKKRIPAVKPRIAISDFRVRQPTAAEIAEALRKAGESAASRTSLEAAFRDLLSGKTPGSPIDPADLDLPLTVSFDIELVNETKAALAFSNLDYAFAVNGAPLVKGSTRDIFTRNGVSVLRVENRFSSKSLAGAVADAFKKGRGEFALTGGAAVKFPDEIKKDPVPLRFEESGVFDLR